MPGSAATSPQACGRLSRASPRKSAQRIADIPEADPEKVAGLITDGVERLLGVTAGRPGDQPVTYHGGLQIDLATLASFYLGEVVLHGYDMAAAVGVPWPIDPAHAYLTRRASGRWSTRSEPGD